MAVQMEELSRRGADGFVIGCLTREGELDSEAMGPLLEAAGEKKLTLHRAMDVSRDLEETYRRAGVLMGLPGLDEWRIQQTDEAAVRLARSVLHNT